MYVAYRTHISALLGEVVGAERAPYLADVLLGALGPDFVLYQRQGLGLAQDELSDGWTQLIEAL